MASRILLAIASSLMGVGAYVHAAAFGKARAALAGTSLPAFFSGSFQALWLADSTTMAALMLMFAALAWRPKMASKPLMALLAVIPAAIAALVYTFLGGFAAGHVMAVTATLVFVAAALG
jgi:hypothetical protein